MDNAIGEREREREIDKDVTLPSVAARHGVMTGELENCCELPAWNESPGPIAMASA